MPSLSERDLRSVEKLFNAMQPILLRTRDQTTPSVVPKGSTPGARADDVLTRADRSLSTSVLSPSAELQEGLSMYSASTRGTAPSSSLTSVADADSLDRRLWTELAFAVWRIGPQKVHLMNFVALDPLGTLAELACRLADFLKSVYRSAKGRFARLLAMAQLSASHVLTLLQLFCARKTCVAMLNGDVTDGLELHTSVCQYLVDKGHFGWMSQLYVGFCDEAAERDAATTCMPTVVVVALREVLECLRLCVEQSKAAAKAFLTAEPIAFVTYMFYGLKLRISRGALLRPHESDDVFWADETHCTTALDSTDEMARMARETFRTVGIPVKQSTAGIVPSKYFSRIVRGDLMRSMEAFQGPTASDSRERKSAELITAFKDMLRTTIPDASTVCQPLSQSEMDQLKVLSAPLGGSSGALNRGGLSRVQLHQFIAFGRLNCFDEMTHHALDVMVEAVRATHSYSHFAVHSTLSSYFQLSVRGMQSLAESIQHKVSVDGSEGVAGADETLSHSMKASNAAAISSRFVTTLLALYENVITIGHVFLAMAESLALISDGGDARTEGTSAFAGGYRRDSTDDVSTVPPSDAPLRSPRETEHMIEQLQEDREQFIQRLLKEEHTNQVRTVIYTVPNLLRSDPMLFAILEEMCRLGAAPPPPMGAADGYGTDSATAAPGSPLGPRQGRYGPGSGLRQTPNESFQRPDGRPPLATSRAISNTSMAMGSFFFGPHQGRAGSPSPGSFDMTGAGGSAMRRRRAPVPTRTNKDASLALGSSATALGKDATPSSPPKDTNFAKSFFKSFFGRKTPAETSPASAGTAALGGAAAHPSQLLENSTSNMDLPHTRSLFGHSGGMGPSRPSLSEFDGLVDDSMAAGGDREQSPPAPPPPALLASWSDVPSYVTFVREQVELFLTVLDDARLNVYVRIAAGLVMSSITFTDATSFDLYEGHVGVRAMMHLMIGALRSAHVTAPAGEPVVTPIDSPSTSRTSRSGRGHGQREDARLALAPTLLGRTDSEEFIPEEQVSPEMNSYDELSTPELVSLVTKVVRLLKKVFFTIGVTPLTSEAVLMTDLPLAFFAEADEPSLSKSMRTGASVDPALDADRPATESSLHSNLTSSTANEEPVVDLKVKRVLELRCFDDVMQLWSHAVNVAVCDDDMDETSFKVLGQIFQRALRRGTLPRPTRPGAHVGGGGGGYPGAGSSFGNNPMGDSGVAGLSSAYGLGLGMSTTSASAAPTLTVTDVRRPAGGSSSSTRRPPLTPLTNGPAGMVSFLNHSLNDDSDAFLHEGYPGSPGYAVGNQSGARGVGGGNGGGDRRPMVGSSSMEAAALSESKVADAIVDIFDNLVHRRPSLLTLPTLQALFDLFSAHEATLTRIGRHGLITTFDYGDVYEVYAKLMGNDSDDATPLLQLLALMSRDMQSEDMSEERLHERRIWLMKSHCINELILRLCRTLKDPHLSPLFVKLVPQSFRLLCAFEPSRETSPHLDDTCFLAAVSDAITNMEGAEFFLIVAQSVIDAATSSFDSVGSYLSGQTAALMTGPLHIMHGKWYAEKQTFLDLVPALASWTLAHDLGLYQCLMEVITGLLQCTSNVNSARLVEFALSAGLPQWLPYLEMPPESVLQMPFAGDPTYLQRFWTPVLTNAPHRSDIRYAMTGGVRLSVGRWPERGFSVSALFKFDALYSTISLFEFQSNETAEMAERPVSVEVVGGDSLQLVQDGYRTTLNESHALQNFLAGKWLPVTLVFSVANTMTAYIGGVKIGTAAVTFFDPGSTATVNVGFVNKSVPTSLFSISDIAVWDDELTTSQVEAHLAYLCFTDYHSGTAKVPEFAIPYMLGRRDTPPPVDDCIAHFVPHEHSDGLLTNLLNTEKRYPLLAKIIGRNAVTPQYWVNYYQLFISRGGAHHLLDWLRRATTSDEVVTILQLLVEAMRRTNSAEMERPFLYLRLAHHLKQIAPLITTRVWDALLHGATSHVVINDEEHRIAINRYLFEFVLGNLEVHNEVDDEVTLYLMERLEKIFNPSTCRYAKHNAQFINPVRFVDRLLNSLVLVANDTSIAVRAATITCAKQVVVACDMEESLVHCLTSLAALLTPASITMVSCFSPSMEVSLPLVRHVRTMLPVLVAQNLTTLILRSLVECAMSHATFMTAFCRVIDLSWYAVCVSRFADPVAVVYATKLFFEAVQRSPALLEDAVAHQASIVEALQAHAIHDDLTLFLLSLTVGCSRHVDLLAQNHSLLQQLDGVLNSCTPEPNAVVAPIFVKIFVCHLSTIVRSPHALPFPINTVRQRHRFNACRIRKYFRLAFLCCRLMMLINLKRYRTTLRVDLRRLREQGGAASPPPPATRRQLSDSVAVEGGAAAQEMAQSGMNSVVGTTGTVTPNRGPALTTDCNSPRREPNHSFTLSFAGGPATLYAPRLPSSFGVDKRTQQGGFLTVPGTGSVSPSMHLTAGNSSFGSEATGSFATAPSRPHVHSSKWKRAFAALRVCVLLWMPIQCRRYRWVFLRKQTIKPEQILLRRHPGTVFALRALRRYSSQPSLFYVFVSSPLETSAMATLLPYISKDRLAEHTQAWTEYLAKLGPSALNQIGRQQSQQLRTPGQAGSPATFTTKKFIADSEVRSMASDDTMTTSPTSMAAQGRQASFPMVRLPPVDHTAAEMAERSMTSVQSTQMNYPVSPHQAAPFGNLSSTMPPPAPAPGNPKSSGGGGGGVAHDEEDEEDEEDGIGAGKSSMGGTTGYSTRDVAASSPLPPFRVDSFVSEPPTVENTAIPERRKLIRPTIQVPSSGPLTESTPTRVDDDSHVPSAAEGGPTDTTPSAAPSPPHRPHGSHTRSLSSSRSSNGNHSRQDSGGSSSSSSSSNNSNSNSNSSRSSSLGATLRDGTIGAPQPSTVSTADGSVDTGVAASRLISESTLLAMADGNEFHPSAQTSETLLGEPPHDHGEDSAGPELALPGTQIDHADMVERAIATLGDGMRQETVGVLSGLIRASLNVLPAQRWSGGPSYGSCGGLLFQLMFISSAATSSEDLSATLVRFFLVEVTTCVHEQQISMDPTTMRVGSPMIPSLSHSLMFDSARNSLSLRGAAAERGAGSSGTASPLNQSGFQGSPMGGNAPVSSAMGGVPSVGFDSAASFRGLGAGSMASGGGTTSSSNWDVLLFNVSHFTELVVDMLSINVLDLMTARDYLHSLLVFCLNWPTRFVDQLSSQVMRACVAVLNRPSQNDVPVEMIRTIYDLTRIVLRPHWHMKGMIECLLRVLYRVYTAFPPVYMSDEDAQLRKDLVVLIYRHIVQTYVGTKELHKALSVRTLTQRFSLYDAFKSTLLKGTDDEACAAFHAYCESHSSAMETLMSGRPRQKADAAFRTTIKIRTEYIKRIKAFNQHYIAEVEMKPGSKPTELVDRYMGLCSSYTASVPRLREEQLALLPMYNCSLPEMLNTEYFSVYHYMDMSRNYAPVARPVPVKVPDLVRRHRHHRHMEEDDRHLSDSTSSLASSASVQSVTAAVSPTTPARRDADAEAELPVEASDAQMGETTPGGTARTRAPPLAEDLELRQAAVCEEQVNHIAALVPAFAVRSRPYHHNYADRPAFIDEHVVVTPSAINLLWYLIDSDEVLRFMSNGFRINGLHATPCLILLTNRTLKVISFSRVTEAGDIVLCQTGSEPHDDDETKSNASSSGLGDGGSGSDGKAGGGRVKRKPGFNILSMTKQLQRLLSDGKSAERKEQIARDGTRVAQAVRQSTSKAYSQLYWSYAARNMRQVRCLRYMHLNTAVLIKMYHDDGVFLSVVDSKQSMNPSVREEFLAVLRDVVKPHRCDFVDSSQRATDMRSMLIRWAAGSVSNYEYLSFLNRTAGRTVKDYNQYPVFPWVLADYVSATLDLERGSTFRDFRYPMGAQLDERREMVAQLYQNTSEIEDPETGKSYPFHHGTHYSTSGAVLYFLLRAEPFTTFARDFQGGNFDVATRLFDSVAASFRSCALGPADCKELLPEFFYNNNFLANADHLDFGCKSDGAKVDDVHLPPWAKGSVQVFTAVMRYALESEHVLHNIHHWIDLVFGVRRRGPLAVERLNTFQRMTYGEEVVVALQQAQTPHDCDVIIAEVDNFGQTPLQLFQERHPSHVELEPVKKPTGASTSINSVSGVPGAGASGIGGAAVSSASFASSEFKPSTLLKASHSAYGGAAEARGGQRSTTLSSGNTYTNAFQKEMPKVMLMLVQALADPITYFELSEPNPALFHPLPPALVDRYRVKPAVTGFVRAGVTQKIVCSFPYMVAVDDERYFVCWHERQGRLLRCLNTDGSFLSVLPFRSPDDRTVRVTTVVVSTCESFLAVAVSNGAIYCFYPTLRDDTVVQTSSLCFHRHAIRGIAVDEVSGRALSYTTDALDHPVVWRVQRCHSGWMQRLDLSRLLPPQESSIETDHDRTVISAHIDPNSLLSIVATPRYLLLFDMNGEPFASGKLPGLVIRRMPVSMSPVDVALAEPLTDAAPKRDDPIMLEDDDGTVGIAVSPTAGTSPLRTALKPLKPLPPPEPDMTCITVYQCTEWAAGMQLFISGHIDGSIGLWRSTRLPPDTVQPGKIAVVEFHHMVIQGDGSAGAVTALWQDRSDVPHFFVGYADGSVKVFSFDEPSVKEDGVKSK